MSEFSFLDGLFFDFADEVFSFGHELFIICFKCVDLILFELAEAVSVWALLC